MGHPTIASAVGPDRVPDHIRSLSTLDRPDYADTYSATEASAADRSAESWSRAILEDTPLGGRARLFWRTLGLELGPKGSHDHVQGWRVAARGDQWIRLEAPSWWARGEVVLRV